MSPSISKCGKTLPLPATFDCASYMTRPADVPPPQNLSLASINRKNCVVEAGNDKSIEETIAYEAARATTAGVGSLDVGAPLQPLYTYSDEQKQQLLHSKELVDSTGPLPPSLVQWMATERLKTAQTAAAEKLRSEQERVDKEQERAKACAPILGSMSMDNPVSFSSVTTEEVVIPPIFLMSLKHKIYPALHWWLSDTLRSAVESPHSIPTVHLRAEQTTSLLTPPKIFVIDTEKMTKFHGGPDSALSKLTPSKWLQCSKNLLAALKQLSVAYDPQNPVHTPYTEYAQHFQFFSKNRWFDEYFDVWYPLEYTMRRAVLVNTKYDVLTWTNELSGTIKAHLAAAACALEQRSYSQEPPHRSSGGKRLSDGEGNEAAAKRLRKSKADGAGKGGNRSPACLHLETPFEHIDPGPRHRSPVTA
ncbi:hypothetical protein C8R45DRAFT_1113776 [Mycena sanguinolenta]|nr:hypothetical protein C8R45DRAFT_1113776 [Mycena sanguinolenta]